MRLARVRLNRVIKEEANGGVVYRKRRTRLAPVGVFCANLFLAVAGCKVRILTAQQWQTREQRMGQATVEEGDVVSPSFPNAVLLAKFLERTNDSAHRLKAIRLAIDALSMLHHGGSREPSSHGDATAINVAIDMATNEACWFDFDTAHLEAMRLDDRRADDFRALLFSSAVFLPESMHNDLAMLAANSIHDDTLAAFRRNLVKWRKPDLFQLAQAPLSQVAHESLLVRLEEQLTP